MAAFRVDIWLMLGLGADRGGWWKGAFLYVVLMSMSALRMRKRSSATHLYTTAMGLFVTVSK